MRLKDREDSWALAAMDAVSFFVGVVAGFWALASLAWPGLAIVVGAGAIAWNRGFRMLAAGLAIGVGAVVLLAAMFDFARPDF